MRVIDILEKYEEKEPGYATKMRALFKPEETLMRILREGEQIGWDSSASEIRPARELYEDNLAARSIIHIDEKNLEGVVFKQLEASKLGLQKQINPAENDYIFGYGIDNGAVVVPGKRFEYVPKGLNTAQKPDAVYVVVSEKGLVYEAETSKIRERTPADEMKDRTAKALKSYIEMHDPKPAVAKKMPENNKKAQLILIPGMKE